MGEFRYIRFLCVLLAAVCLSVLPARAESLPKEILADYVMPPFSIGPAVNDKGVWTLLNSGGAEAGFVFETEPLAPLPGFSGTPINILVILDLDGRFMDVRLITHNEPIFVSGLGEAPFQKFFEQYRGHSISSSLVVGTPYGDGDAGSSLVYLDGVTKATASIRIAHESVLAATLAVAREKMQGVSTGPPAYPDRDHDETLTWQDLVDTGLVTRKTVQNHEVDAAFAGTLWEEDDPEAQDDPDGVYLDLWIIDLGPPSIARTVLSDDSFDELQNFLSISTYDEPLLIIDAGRHGLVSDAFVRNTAPDWLSAEQDGLPVALRDADLLVELNDDLPDDLHDGTAMILRTDRRLGFDPTRDWTLNVQAVREHGIFQPDVGSVTLSSTHSTDERFFMRPGIVEPVPPWQDALFNRAPDLIVLAAFLIGLMGILYWQQGKMASLEQFTPARLGILAFVVGFVGWWGQGQLSIVTVLGALRAGIDRASFSFLLYDPFSLLIWVAAIVGFVLWGRGLFCGWLCPFGALQEFAHHIGRLLRLPQYEPSRRWDAWLKCIKYVLLAGLVGTVFVAPGEIDTVAEIEPFKTAITVYFVREWYFVVYAVSWLLLGTMLFKGFCRYVCPLGAVMAIGGLFRGRDWIDRRSACGSPCQLCKVKCKYGAISQSGTVDYSECFQCLDCVKIHDDEKQCVPLILAARKQYSKVAAE
ncbi:4Fe-4S binding protein [Hoeflea sp. TYP-13]|uniref:4Fe-4S binding protein n=1 Tax=Hoeflea sp. TYP-13 TaxID=3230023 RepID=UPI0034C6BF51